MPQLPPRNPTIGIALIVTAMLVVPFMDAIAKLLSAQYPVLQLVWARFFFQFLVVTPLALWRHSPIGFVTKQPFLQVGRGLFLLAATVCFWAAIKYIPLADAIALLFFDAVIIVSLSALVLRERVQTSRWVAAGVGLIGVLMIVRPGFEAFHWASLLALAAAVFFSAFFLSNRVLAGEVVPLVALSYQSVGGFLVMTAIMPFIWVTPTATDLALMLAIGLIGATGHLLLIRAFEHADASLLAPYLYAEIIMQVVLGYWLFNDLPGSWTWLGIALIIIVGIFLSIAQKKASRSDNQPIPGAHL